MGWIKWWTQLVEAVQELLKNPNNKKVTSRRKCFGHVSEVFNAHYSHFVHGSVREALACSDDANSPSCSFLCGSSVRIFLKVHNKRQKPFLLCVKGRRTFFSGVQCMLYELADLQPTLTTRKNISSKNDNGIVGRDYEVHHVLLQYSDQRNPDTCQDIQKPIFKYALEREGRELTLFSWKILSCLE